MSASLPTNAAPSGSPACSSRDQNASASAARTSARKRRWLSRRTVTTAGSPGSRAAGADRQVAGQAGARQQALGAGADDADDRELLADVAVRQVAAVAALADRRAGGERGVRADEQRVARVGADEPDVAQAPPVAGRQRRIAEAGDERAVEQRLVALQLEDAEVRAVGEPDALHADGDLALHVAVVPDEAVPVARVEHGARGDARRGNGRRPAGLRAGRHEGLEVDRSVFQERQRPIIGPEASRGDLAPGVGARGARPRDYAARRSSRPCCSALIASAQMALRQRLAILMCARTAMGRSTSVWPRQCSAASTSSCASPSRCAWRRGRGGPATHRRGAGRAPRRAAGWRRWSSRPRASPCARRRARSCPP